MSYSFYIKHLDRSAVVKSAAVVDFLSLSFKVDEQEAGWMTVSFNGDHRVIQDLELYDLFEVYWKNDYLGLTSWQLGLEVFYDGALSDRTDDNLTRIVTLYLPGQLAILGLRQIAWASGVNNRSTFSLVPAETIAKTIVTYNVTSSATIANGRLRDGDLAAGMGWTIAVEADSGGGNLDSRSFSNGNLLRVIVEELSPVAGGAFSLVRTPAGGVDARWVFAWHNGQLGTDKRTGSDAVQFSLLRANMRNPSLSLNPVRTVAIAGGTGVGDSRLYATVTGATYAADNDVEMYVNANNQETVDRVISAALLDLQDEVDAGFQFDFDAIQTQAVFYSRVAVAGRKTYQVGDLVTAVYQGVTYDRKVKSVTFDAVSRGGNEPDTMLTVETVAV